MHIIFLAHRKKISLITLQKIKVGIKIKFVISCLGIIDSVCTFRQERTID